MDGNPSTRSLRVFLRRFYDKFEGSRGLMLTQIGSDESSQVLLFVVLPLLLLLIGGVIWWIRRIPPSVAKFPTFSMRVERLGRDGGYIVYQDNDRRLEFYVGPNERKQAQCLALPDKLSDQIIEELVPHLVTGLAKLRFQKYKILKEGEPTILAASPRGSFSTPE
jgi:hypothetical protein